jgi:hypothetical protein
MTDRYQVEAQCINNCLPFIAFGTPTHCPYCGIGEVYAIPDDMEMYETVDEHYENANANSGTQ